MIKKTGYFITSEELKRIIDYVRAEARLSFQLQNRLWLTQENIKLQKQSLDLAIRFRDLKKNFRGLVDKDFYKEIVKDEEVDTKFQNITLKKNEKKTSEELPIQTQEIVRN